jgi:tRNA(fMet)-specific endonuclease VapC
MALKIAIDSNRYSDLCRGLPEVVEIIETADEIYVPVIVLAEQRAGFAHGSARQKNERVLTRFMNTAGVFVLLPDEQTTFFYADLYAYLRKKGRPIPTNDLWIAALTIQHNLVLFDRDSDFDAIPQLARLALPRRGG